MDDQFTELPVMENIRGSCAIGATVILKAKENGYSITRAARRYSGIHGGKVYEIIVPYSIKIPALSKTQAIVSWFKPGGVCAARSYLDIISDDVMKINYHVPEDVTEMEIEYRLWSDGGGEAEFGMPVVTGPATYVPRVVNLATAWFDTSKNRTLNKNFADMLRIVDNAGCAADKPDILTFSEAVYGRGVPGVKLAEAAVRLDGEVINRLKQKAARYKMYIVVGLHIIDGGQYKNAAVILDRSGSVAGVYIKTHLTMEERERGLVSGTELPVFDLDFGRVGILICWDHFFSEPVRVLHQKGAEVIIIPTAGDTLYQCRARAVDSGAYVVMSGTRNNKSSFIMEPAKGETIAAVAENGPGYASASVDLNKRQTLHWLSVGPCDGEGKNIYLHERRPELYGDLAKEDRYDVRH